MLFKYYKKTIEKHLHFFCEEGNVELTKRLVVGNYITPFNILKNRNLVRTFAINRYKLTSHYIHLLESGHYDEN